MTFRVPVVPAKLRPPVPPAKFLRRNEYSDWADALTGRRLTTVTAPAGYGKTVAMSTMAADLADRGVRAAWLSLDGADADVGFLLAYLVAAIEAAHPGSGHEAQRVLASVADPERDWGLVVASVCEGAWSAMPAAPQAAVIFIDDCHLLASVPVALDCLRYLLTNLPPHLSFCLASRSELPLSLARLSLSGAVWTIGLDELAFSSADGAHLLIATYQLPLTQPQAEQLVDSSEGWAAGLVLAAQALRNSPGGLSQVDAWLHGRPDAAFAYFTDEVLATQQPALRDFLTQAANLRHLTVAACVSILGEDDAEAQLERAIRDGLFIARVDTPDGRVYRLHHLFEACLRDRWREQHGPAEVRRLDLAAASYYEAAGLADPALAHLFAAGETDAAAELLHRVGQSLIDAGRTEQLRHWLARLPEDALAADPLLLYWQGFVNQQSDPPLAAACLDQAATAFAAAGQPRLQVRSLIHLATLYSLQNRVDEVAKVVARIPLIRALALDPWARGVLVVSALCQAAWDDNLRRGAWLARLARRFRLDPDWQWAMLAYSCMINYRLGELDLAGRLIDEGLALPEVQNNDVWRGMGIILKHVVLYSQDDEAAAQPLRDQLWDLGERYDSPYYKAYAMRTFAFPHVHQGRRELAAENLRASLYFFDRAGNEGMTLITRLDLANLAASAGHDSAVAVLPEARAALQRLVLINPGQGLVDQGQSLFGAVACAAGAYDEAERQLLASAGASRRKGARQILAGTCLHLANLYAEQGRDKDADRHLEEALSLAEQGGYRVFWDWSRPVIQAMLTRAGERRIHAEYALQLQRHWFADPATATVRAETAATTLTEAEATSGTADAAAPRLSIRLLGDFSVSVDGQEVSAGAWQTRKVKSLLKILALNRGRRVRREQLAEQLWPEAEPESSAASLRVTMTRLRRALASVGNGGGAAALQTGVGFVALRSDLVAPTDAERFISDVEHGLTLRERGDATGAAALLTPALAAYGGGLLPEDIYEEYATIERERLQLLYHDALLALAAIRRDGGDRDGLLAARDLLRQALALDPLHEDTVHALVQTHLALGQRAEATAIYRRYRQRLQAEYGTEPGHRLTELVASEDNR